ncbi:MAG: helix-turn-helix domain-containing protein [Cloacibacillus sp.]|nr:helix-turn-helix domain-containing protein [Cloacibacillus sp.]
MTIGDRIKKVRRYNGMTQEKLAELLGVSRVTISSWENDENAPTADNVIYLSEIFHISTDYLLKDAVKPNAEELERASATRQDEIFLKLFQAFSPAERDDVIKFMRYKEFLSKERL